MPVKVELARRARADLVDIEDYLANQASVRTAERVVERILGKIETLAHYPKLGVERPDLGSGNRMLVLKPYVIVYAIVSVASSERVAVLRIFHGARDIPSLMTDD